MVYKRRHGDCNVPRGWAEDPPLGRWASTQREAKLEGMMVARAARLEALGFAWAPSRR